jgi:hypothetical protein
MAMPTSPIESTLAVTVEDARIRSNGRTGSRTRRSTNANTMSSAAAAARAATTWGEVHGYCCPPHTRPSSSAQEPRARMAPPSQSTEWSRFSVRRGMVR